MNHKDAIKQVEAAIAQLSKPGVEVPLTISAVVKAAGISRSTVYTNNEDWRRIRNRINGHEVQHTPNDSTGLLSPEVQEFRSLAEKVKLLQSSVQEVKTKVEATFQKMLNSLQEQCIRAREAESSEIELARHNKNVAELEHQVQVLSARLVARENLRAVPDSRHPTRKEVVVGVPTRGLLKQQGVDLLDLVIESLDKLQPLFSPAGSQMLPAVAYVLTGNFASGKSRWITQHHPVLPGTNVYLEATHHTRNMRKMVVQRLRSLHPGIQVVCVWVRTNLEVCKLRNKNPERLSEGTDVPDALIRTVDEEFEGIDHKEGFNELVYVS